MFYEDYILKAADTLTKVAEAYGYKAADANKIWNDAVNGQLVKKRKTSNAIAAGDKVMIPIPWKVTSTSNTANANGTLFKAERDGEGATQVTWVQTVYQSNQVAAGTDQSCVDGCPADDDLPFYYTTAELTADPNRRKKFSDKPGRNPPAAGKGTTSWRAIVSLGVVTEKRVTVWNSQVWGFDMTEAGVVSTVGPRAAKKEEIVGHVALLSKGKGTGPDNFGKAGWTFRRAP